MQFWGHTNMHSFSAGQANIARFALYNERIHDACLQVHMKCVTHSYLILIVSHVCSCALSFK